MFLHGITVKLHEKKEVGKDELNRPVYEDTTVNVDNVLVGEPNDQDIAAVDNITGRKVAYALGIPKGDTHNWIDTEVEFFGEKFRTVGIPVQGIEDMIPLAWNKRVRVERYE